ncbi:SGNH/GDSL hydrolase family protein [Planctomycetota bacterium]
MGHTLFQNHFMILMLLTCRVWAVTASDDSTAQYPDPNRFASAIRAFEQSDASQPPPSHAILCIGSSSMRGWHTHIAEDLAPLTLLLRGFGGSNMNDLLFYMDRVVLPYRPRALVIYEGDNDIAHGIAPITIQDTFMTFYTRLRAELPECRVYFLSIKPSISRWSLWPRMQEANHLMEILCRQDKHLTYIDIAGPMLNSAGEPKPEIFLDDKLHMNRAGYLLWREVVKPVLIKGELRFETHFGD